MKIDLRKIKIIDNESKVRDALIKEIRRKKYIVYGARSINKQNLFERPTNDWDLFAMNPKKEGDFLQKQLDKAVGFDYFYLKAAKHKGTWKVMDRGKDLIKGNEDDGNIVDFSKTPNNISTINIDGIRYRKLKEEIKAKQKSLRDKSQKFRHEKDRGDLNRIKAYLRINKMDNLKI